MAKAKDLTGQIFGRLTVLECVGKNNSRHYFWRCRCTCGVEIVVQGSHLKSGNTQSCGCLQREKTGEANQTHGLSYSSVYHVWSHIKSRCFDLKHKQYKDYGGRGIKMYSAWIDNFQAFYDYVSKLEHFGENGYTLDRINNDGNYEPGNLKFSTKSEQARNRRVTIFVEYNGEKMTLVDAAEKSGISYQTLASRLKSGDTGERLFRPVGK